jgi:hypothetical protein
MKKLLTILTLSLAASSAFAGESGDITINVMNNIEVATIKLTGTPAATLYEFLDVPAVPSKTFPGSMVKSGPNITCYMSYGTLGQMISPVIQMYNCSQLITSDGSIEGDSEVGTD